MNRYIIILISVILTSISSCGPSSEDILRSEVSSLRRNYEERISSLSSQISRLNREIEIRMNEIKLLREEYLNKENINIERIDELNKIIEELNIKIEQNNKLIEITMSGDFIRAFEYARGLRLDIIDEVDVKTIELVSALSSASKLNIASENYYEHVNYEISSKTRYILQVVGILFIAILKIFVIVLCIYSIGYIIYNTSDREQKIAYIALSSIIIFGYFASFASFGMKFSSLLFEGTTNISEDTFTKESILKHAPIYFIPIIMGFLSSKIFYVYIGDSKDKEDNMLLSISILSIVFIYSIESSLNFMVKLKNNIPLENALFVISIVGTYIYLVFSNKKEKRN